MKRVAVIPLAKFTTEADHKLVADLATSVERAATLKLIRAHARWHLGNHIAQVLEVIAAEIECGNHV